MNLFSNEIASSLIGSDQHILYACSCQEYKPITRLYFCRHCTKLRCEKCVAHEVDSFYCPNCLENMPSAEAKLKKNRCANCFDCPSCGHTLGVRATAVPSVSSPDPKKASPSKKMHYLYCGFCRWMTRDIGLPDQSTLSGGWPDVELPFSKKMAALLDYYKHVAHQDKIEKERQKLTKRKTNLYLMDRYGYSLSLGKKRSGSIGAPSLASSLLSRTSSLLGKEVTTPLVANTVTNMQQIEDLFYTQPLDLEQVMTLEQRLKAVSIQGSKAKDLYPKQKHLTVRRSQRCKECEHNLCKPEFNPSSIKFKIQLGGMQYCPNIQMHRHLDLLKDEEHEIILSVTNPLDTAMTITFSQMEESPLDKTAEITLPTVSLMIVAKDATVEFDGVGMTSAETFNDDPQVVFKRASNKLSFYTRVKPFNDSGNVIACFMMRYQYKMTTAPLILKSSDEKSPKSVEHLVSLDVPVKINCGLLKI